MSSTWKKIVNKGDLKVNILKHVTDSSLPLVKIPLIHPKRGPQLRTSKILESPPAPILSKRPPPNHRKREHPPHLGKLRRTDHAILPGGPSGENDLALSAQGEGLAHSLANCQEPRHARCRFGVQRAVVAAQHHKPGEGIGQ